MTQRKDAREEMREEASGRLSDVADQAQESIERLENAFSAFWEEASNDETQPYLRHLARANIEVIRLLGRQSKACAELPARLVACQSPHDVWAEHMQFWRQSFNDYQAATSRMMDAMTATAMSGARNAGGQLMAMGNQGGKNGSGRERRRRSGE